MADNLVNIIIGAQTGAAAAQIKTFTRQAGQALNDLVGIQNLLTGAVQSLIGALSARALWNLVKDTGEAIQATDRLARQIGTTVEQMSRLEYAAGRADLELQEFRTGLRTFSNAISEAVADPASQAARQFDALGVSLKNQDGTIRDTDEVLLDTAESFKRYADGPNKISAATALFGRSSMQWITFLNQGRGSIEELGAQADKLGVTIGKDLTGKSEELDQSLKTINTAFTALKLAVFNEAAPAIVAMLTVMTEGETNLASFGEILGTLLKLLTWFGTSLAYVFELVGLKMAYYGGALVEGLRGNHEVAMGIIRQEGAAIDELDRRYGAALDKIWNREKPPVPVVPGMPGSTEGQGGKLPMPGVTSLSYEQMMQTTIKNIAALQSAEYELEMARLKDTYDQRLITTQQYYDQTELLLRAHIARAQAAALKEASFAPDAKLSEASAKAWQDVHILDIQQQAALLKQQADLRTAHQTEVQLQLSKLDLSKQELAAQNQLIQADWRLTDPQKWRADAEFRQARLAQIQKEVALQEQLLTLQPGGGQEALSTQAKLQALRAEQAQLKQAGPDPNSLGDQLTLKFGEVARSWGTMAQQMATVLTTTVTSAVQGLSNALANVIMGTQNAAQAFGQFALNMATSFIASVVQMVLIATVAIPILTALGVVSGGSIPATGAAVTSIAMGTAASLSASVVGRAGGGIIPGRSSDVDDQWIRAASGEFVIRARAVDFYGAALIEALNQMRIPKAALADLRFPSPNARSGSFATGGLVGPAAGTNVNVAPADVHFAVLHNRSELEEWAKSRSGRKILVDVISGAKAELGIRA